MNDYQLCRLVKDRLEAAVWPGTSNPVFGTGSVLISAGLPAQAMLSLRWPAVLINVGDGTNDPDHNEEPGMIRTTLDLLVFHSVEGDTMGERALLGANRQPDTSEGAGLFQIQDRVFDELEYLGVAAGVKSQARARGAATADLVGPRYVVQRGLRFEADISIGATYPGPKNLRATVAGANVTLEWILPPARYDLYRLICRRVAGSTPTDDPAGGVEVPLGSNLPTSVVDTPGLGTWSYSLFATYDEVNQPPNTDTLFSTPAVVTAEVV